MRAGAQQGAQISIKTVYAEVREVVNGNLPTGWTLDENQFIGPTPIPEDALNIIRNTVDEVEFWGLAQYYDNGD